MKLFRTRQHWDEFARTDPFWAVLTEQGKAENRWRVDEFFKTGVDSVNAEIKGVLMHYPALRFGSALDFGCGVGRLSQALAHHFAKVVGIDISKEMLRHAALHNRHGEKVSFIHNTRADLRCVPADSFDFVYSVITLQHMEPAYARRYICEFVRVAARGGVILFQIPSVKEKVIKPVRPFTLWPDTLLKRMLRDYRTRKAAGPIMEMHAMAREEVEALLAKAGAQLIKSYRYDAAGDRLSSWGYLAVKP